MKFALKVLVSAIAVFITAHILPGVDVESFLVAILVALVLAVLNILLKPLLVALTIPVTIMSFGLFLLVINAFIIQIVDYLIEKFEVTNFWWALLFSVILSVITWILEMPIRKRNVPGPPKHNDQIS